MVFLRNYNLINQSGVWQTGARSSGTVSAATRLFRNFNASTSRIIAAISDYNALGRTFPAPISQGFLMQALTTWVATRISDAPDVNSFEQNRSSPIRPTGPAIAQFDFNRPSALADQQRDNRR